MNGRRPPAAEMGVLRTRQVAAIVCALGVVLLVGLAWRSVPWQPVPGVLPEPVSPGSVFSSAEIVRSEAYSSKARWLGWSSVGLSIAVLAGLGFTGYGKQALDRQRGPWLWRVTLAVVGVQLIVRLVTLPWALVARENRVKFGLTSQPLPEFLRDLGFGFAVQAAATVLALGLIVGCARRWRRVWPAVAGVALFGLTVIASFVYPVVIEPVFNEFESLPSGPAREQVFALAEAEGVVLGDVLVADASRRTTSLNAYVSGFGATRRVVLYDTLVSDVPPDQVAAVVAHELAHAKYDDVLTGSVLGALGVLLGVGLLGLVLPAEGSANARARWTTARDPAVVPLLLALTAVASLVVAPIQNTISRRVETRADVTALAVTGDGQAAEELQRSLAVRALSDPTPPTWSQFWFGSHPTSLQRIALARRTAE